MTNKQKQREEERNSAIAELKKLFPPGGTAYTILRHRSRSGTSRAISVVVNNRDISHLVAQATGYALSKKHDGLSVSGCNMDMGVDVVQNLSRALYPSGYGCYGENCRSNDHANGDRNYTPHGEVDSHWHRNGDYAIRQEWL